LCLFGRLDSVSRCAIGETVGRVGPGATHRGPHLGAVDDDGDDLGASAPIGLDGEHLGAWTLEIARSRARSPKKKFVSSLNLTDSSQRVDNV